MHTERLYYHDSYLSEFDAQIVRLSSDGKGVYLDRTAFYPASGGQPNDVGAIAGVALTDVIDEGEEILHQVAEPLQPGPAHCTLNWQRRLDHMQQHTGQHLLSAVLLELFGYETLSFHMGKEVSTIELNAPELTEVQAENAEVRCAELIARALPVTVSFEDAQQASDLRKKSMREGTLRVINISGIDRSACGGTHLRSTAELGLILIRGQEKVRGHARIEFVCGQRSLRRAREDAQLLSAMARSATAPVEELPGLFRSARERLIEAEKDRSRLASELARRDGEALWSATPVSSDGLRRIQIERSTLDESARSLVQSFVERGRAAILVISPRGPTLLLAASNDAGIHAGNTLKAALQECKGRGGGSATMAQGTVPSGADLDAIAAELGFAPASADSN